MTLWIDVDDLLFHLIHHGRPSGIQRVVFEFGTALRELEGENVQFVRRGPDNGDPRDFRTVDWSFIETLFRRVMTPEDLPASRQPDYMPGLPDGQEQSDVLPAILRMERQVLQSMASLPGTMCRLVTSTIRKRRKDRAKSLTGALSEGTRLSEAARAGDVFLTLGAPWHHETYSQTVRWLRDDLRMYYGLLMHDLIPILRPEWCHQGLVKIFERWHQDIFPLTDMIFANSHATASDVQDYLAQKNISTKPVLTAPLGAGFGVANAAMSPVCMVEGPYVLFVSTIEARKNHTLLFRVWRQLLEDIPADAVPTLVFAGRVGWLVSDLMQQLENTQWLDGKIRFIQNPTDAELQRLYANCSFSVFPSFCEGWGLPVTESLAMGRPCIASNTTSIPEAGGTLGRYFDPTNLHDAYDVIRRTIENPEDLAAWTRQVQTEFKPNSWKDSARIILDSALSHATAS